MPPRGYIFIWWLIFICMSCLTHQTPVISSVSKEQIKDIGDNVKLDCIVDNIEDFSVSWSKNNPTGSVFLAMRNSLALKDSRYNVSLEEDKEKSKTHYTLEIKKLEAADMGIYECQVITSSTDIVKKEVNLLVRHPPVILESDAWTPFTVAEGKDATISCSAQGYPRPTISWKRENNAIMPQGGHVYHGKTMKLSPVHRSDRGIYYCIADNYIGEPAKKPINIEVEFPPHVHAPRPKVAQAKFYSVEMECKVEAYPAPVIEWYRNGKPILSGENYRITTIATEHEITSSVLRIQSVSEYDYGDYYCNATNKMGHSKTRINLLGSQTPDINFPGLIWSNIANNLNLSRLLSIFYTVYLLKMILT